MVLLASLFWDSLFSLVASTFGVVDMWGISERKIDYIIANLLIHRFFFALPKRKYNIQLQCFGPISSATDKKRFASTKRVLNGKETERQRERGGDRIRKYLPEQRLIKVKKKQIRFLFGVQMAPSENLAVAIYVCARWWETSSSVHATIHTSHCIAVYTPPRSCNASA